MSMPHGVLVYESLSAYALVALPHGLHAVDNFVVDLLVSWLAALGALGLPPRPSMRRPPPLLLLFLSSLQTLELFVAGQMCQ